MVKKQTLVWGVLQINHNYDNWTLKSPKRLQQILTHARRASRETFIILAIVSYAQVWDHDGKLLASELAQALCFCEETRKNKFLS
jgi:hypothetical protein